MKSSTLLVIALAGVVVYFAATKASATTSGNTIVGQNGAPTNTSGATPTNLGSAGAASTAYYGSNPLGSNQDTAGDPGSTLALSSWGNFDSSGDDTEATSF